jgi:thioredoxin 1
MDATTMGALTSVTDESFEAVVLGSQQPVLVEYWAPWCVPCLQLAPVLTTLAAENAGQLAVVKLNIDENPLTTQRYQILSVPTMSLFSGGEVVKQVVGLRPASALKREFAPYL